jgi:hypothetical protein
LMMIMMMPTTTFAVAGDADEEVEQLPKSVHYSDGAKHVPSYNVVPKKTTSPAIKEVLAIPFLSVPLLPRTPRIQTFPWFKDGRKPREARQSDGGGGGRGESDFEAEEGMSGKNRCCYWRHRLHGS